MTVSPDPHEQGPPRGGLREASVRGVAWSAVGYWGRQIAQLAVFTTLVRLLGPADFGLIALASVFTQFLHVLGDFGLSSALVQRKKVEQAHIDSVFSFGTIAGIAFCVAAQFLAGPVGTLLGEPRLGPVLRVLSLSLILQGASSTLTAWFKRDLRFKTLALRQLFAYTLGGAVGIAVALAGGGVWALVAQTLAQSAVSVAVLGVSSPIRLHPRVSTRHFRELAGFGANVAGSGILEVVNRRTDDLLIGAFLGPVALGYYSVAYRFLLVLTRLFTQTLSDVALPTFSRLQSNPGRMRRAFYTATRTSAALAFPAFFGMAAVAPDFITAVFGPRWQPSVPVMRVLALIGVLHSVTYFNHTVMHGMGRAGWALSTKLLSTSANVVGFLIAVRYGIVAVAWAYVIRAYLLTPLPLWLVHRLVNYDLRQYLRQLAAPAAASSLMVASIIGVDALAGRLDLASPTAQLALGVTIGALVYGAALFALRRELVRELVGDLMVLRRRLDRGAVRPPAPGPTSGRV